MTGPIVARSFGEGQLDAPLESHVLGAQTPSLGRTSMAATMRSRPSVVELMLGAKPPSSPTLVASCTCIRYVSAPLFLWVPCLSRCWAPHMLPAPGNLRRRGCRPCALHPFLYLSAGRKPALSPATWSNPEQRQASLFRVLYSIVGTGSGNRAPVCTFSQQSILEAHLGAHPHHESALNRVEQGL